MRDRAGRPGHEDAGRIGGRARRDECRPRLRRRWWRRRRADDGRRRRRNRRRAEHAWRHRAIRWTGRPRMLAMQHLVPSVVGRRLRRLRGGRQQEGCRERQRQGFHIHPSVPDGPDAQATRFPRDEALSSRDRCYAGPDQAPHRGNRLWSRRSSRQAHRQGAVGGDRSAPRRPFRRSRLSHCLATWWMKPTPGRRPVSRYPGRRPRWQGRGRR